METVKLETTRQLGKLNFSVLGKDDWIYGNGDGTGGEYFEGNKSDA